MRNVVTLRTLPECYFCSVARPPATPAAPTPARYDFRTVRGSWAYGCEQHYHEYRSHTVLGTGRGQYLQTETEVVTELAANAN